MQGSRLTDPASWGPGRVWAGSLRSDPAWSSRPAETGKHVHGCSAVVRPPPLPWGLVQPESPGEAAGTHCTRPAVRPGAGGRWKLLKEAPATGHTVPPRTLPVARPCCHRVSSRGCLSCAAATALFLKPATSHLGTKTLRFVLRRGGTASMCRRRVTTINCGNSYVTWKDWGFGHSLSRRAKGQQRVSSACRRGPGAPALDTVST